jgi:hypothetical protein
MRRLLQMFLVALAFVTFSVPRHAQAQSTPPLSCASYNGTCISGAVYGSNVAIQVSSYNSGAVLGTDTGSGDGVIGSAATGIGVYGGTDDNAGPGPSGRYGVYGEASARYSYAGYFIANGSGTAGTSAALYGNATSTNDSTATGVLGTGYGYGVYGYSGNGYGVYGSSAASGSDGVAGINTGNGNGVYGYCNNGSKSNAVAGVYATNTQGGWSIYSTGVSA